MTSAEILEKLKQEMPLLRSKFGVDEIGLFGSYARNEATADSDVDILVKLQQPNFIKLAGLLNHLENLLKTKVDIITKHSRLSPRFLNRIEKEIVYAG
ncbi:MAG: hypothetical protein POELPBGB_01076 [Bacteroidia bacterium]|nr:hypothetical protein [Bacteroidia bacterium]